MIHLKFVRLEKFTFMPMKVHVDTDITKQSSRTNLQSHDFLDIRGSYSAEMHLKSKFRLGIDNPMLCCQGEIITEIVHTINLPGDWK